MAASAVDHEQAGRAVGMLAAAAALRQTIGSPADEFEEATNARTAEAARLALGDEHFDSTWDTAHSLALKHDIEYAIAALEVIPVSTAA